MKIDIYGSRENMHQRSLTVVHIISRTLHLTVVERYFTGSGLKLLQKRHQSPQGHIPHILDIHKTLRFQNLMIVGLLMYHITRVTTYIHYRIFIVVYGNARVLSVLPEPIARGMKTPNSLRTVHV